MKKVYLIVGESGCGKSSIVEEFVHMGYKSLDSYTTRPPRYEGEKGHIFVDEKQYMKDKTNDNIVAYTYFNNYHYYCTKQQLLESDFYIIDPDGVNYLKQSVDDIEFITIYIKVGLLTRIFRMLKRGDGVKKTFKRLLNDFKKFKNVEYDYIIRNDYISVAILDINSIVWKNHYIDKDIDIILVRK